MTNIPPDAQRGDSDAGSFRAFFQCLHDMCQGHPMLDFSYLQLGRGDFAGDFWAHMLPNGIFWRSRINVAVEGECDIPSGYLMAALSSGNQDIWHSRAVPADSLALGTNCSGFEHRTCGHHEAWVWLIRYERYREVAEVMEYTVPTLERLPVLSVAQASPLEFRLAIQEFLDAAHRAPGLTPSQAKRFEETLILGTLPFLAHGGTHPTSYVVEKSKMASAVRDLLHQSSDTPLCMLTICSEIGLSERTVRAHFRKHYDISPGAYHLILRLNHAKNLLLSARPERGAVSRAATESGFWHMGRFATHYKRQFGESPGATVLRSSKGV